MLYLSHLRWSTELFAVIEPIADGFCNDTKIEYSFSREELPPDKSQLFGLTATEMTVLIGGMRTLAVNFEDSKHGVLIKHSA
ncbi:MAG: hypothetical protein K6L76_07735 [Agarilytica sp.]